MAKTFAFRHGYEIDANKELIAQGASNLVSSFFRGHPVSASFSRYNTNNNNSNNYTRGYKYKHILNDLPPSPSVSQTRTAVNNEMGAQTPLAGVITALIICIFLLFLTPIFRYLPNFVLASIVILSVRSLIDYKEAIYLWKVNARSTILLP